MFASYFIDIHLVFTEAVETWRNEKLKEAKNLALGGESLNSTLVREEAGNS